MAKMTLLCCERCGDIFEGTDGTQYCESCRAMKAKSEKYAKSAQKVAQAAKIMVTCVDCGTVFKCRAATPTERCTICRRKRAREKQKEYRHKEREEFSALLKSSGYKPPTETVLLCQRCFHEFRAPKHSHPKYCADCRETAYTIKKKIPYKKPTTITEVVKAAAAMGLSYGDYVRRYGAK